MIYDRTSQDVEKAKKIVDEKIKNFLSITEEEEATLEKGYVTTKTLNRIEQKQSELKDLFAEMGYYNVNIQNKDWNTNDLFKENDLKRIIDNIVILRLAFFSFAYTPSNPVARYDYYEFNKMEKILYDLETMIDEIKKMYVECGTVQCGEV